MLVITVCLICPFVASYGQGTPLSATYSTIAGACGQDNGSVTILASGGNPPYTYSFSGQPFQSSAYYVGSPSKPLQALVKDATGASFSLTVQIPNTNPGVSLNPNLGTAASDCATGNGHVTLAGSGGLPPYMYSKDSVNWQSGNVFGNLEPGYYLFLVRDANGCIGRFLFFLNSGSCYMGDYESPGFFYSVCGAPASIYVVPRGIPPPLLYSIDDGATWQSDPNFIEHTGQYTIQIKDATGALYLFRLPVLPYCPVTFNAAIQNATCGNNDGSITANASGGNPPFTYSLDGIHFQSSNFFSGLPGGNYTVLVMDVNSNILLFPNQIVDGGCPPVTATVTETNASCTVNGTISVTADGGTPPYQYSLDQINWQAANSFMVASGSYTITVTDTKGSSTTVAATVALIDDTLTISPPGNPTVCPGKSTTIMTQSNGHQFSWTPATGLSDPTVLQPQASPDTTTTFTLTAVLGSCQATANVTVYVTAPPDAFIGNDTSIAAGQPVPLNVLDLNNSGFTTFSWSPPQGLNDPGIRNPVANVDQSTTYTVVAATPGGCQATASIAIKVYTATDIFVPNAFTPNGDGHNDVLRAIPVGIRKFSWFAVFDHWGQRVFFTSNAAAGWDGTYKGHRLKADTYVWVANGIDYNGTPIARKGTVILIR